MVHKINLKKRIREEIVDLKSGKYDRYFKGKNPKIEVIKTLEWIYNLLEEG